MNIRFLYFLCVFVSTSLFSAESHPQNSTLFIGSIQFPKTIQFIPDVSVFWGGQKIEREIDHTSKKLTFALHEDRNQTQFTLLIAPIKSIKLEKDENTILARKIDTSLPYKFYIFTLKEIVKDDVKHNQQPTYTWVIKECKIPFSDGKIPDSTIIVIYNPAFVETVRGGNAVQLPTIVIKPDIVSLVGSEVNLHDESLRMLLPAMDHEAFHTKARHLTKVDPCHKTIVSITV